MYSVQRKINNNSRTCMSGTDEPSPMLMRQYCPWIVLLCGSWVFDCLDDTPTHSPYVPSHCAFPNSIPLGIFPVASNTTKKRNRCKTSTGFKLHQSQELT